MSDPSASSFGKICVEKGYATEAQIREAIDVKAKLSELDMEEKLGVILIKKGYMTEEQVKEILHTQGQRTSVQIAGYEIIEKVGQGAMGVVFRARQISLDRIVALKILPPSLAKDQGFIDRFIKEARAAGRLNHPNIVQGIDVGQSGGYNFFAMEFIVGETVKEYMTREGVVNEKLTLSICADVARALEHAHEHGLVHGDVKPDNIMITEKSQAKLCDLGLARPIATDAAGQRTDTVMGTPHYISPEQARGQLDIDIRSDIYSLGATLYHMITCRTLFEGKSSKVVMTKHLTEDMVSPRELNPDVSKGLVNIVGKMLAREREDRYQIPQDLAADVERVRGGRLPKAARGAGKSRFIAGEPRRGPERERERSRQRDTKRAATRAVPLPLIMGVVGVLALLLIVGIIVGSGGGSPKPSGAGNRNPSLPKTKPRKKPRNNARSNPVPNNISAGKVNKRTEQTQLLLAAARAYRNEHPEDYPQILKRLAEARRYARKTPLLSEVDQELEAVHKERDDKRTAYVEDLWNQARAFMQQRKYQAAQNLFTVEKFGPNLFKDTPDDTAPGYAKVLRKAQRQIEDLAHKDWEEQRKQAEKLLAAGQPQPAREQIESFAQTDLLEIQVLYARLLTRIEQAESQANRGVVQQRAAAARRLYEQAMNEAVAAGIQGQLTAAKKQAATAAANAELAEFRARFEQFGRDLDDCIARRASLVAGVRGLVGETIAFTSRQGIQVRGKVVDVRGETLTLRLTGGGMMKIEASQLPLDPLIAAGNFGKSRPAKRYALGLLYLFSGERGGVARAKNYLRGFKNNPRHGPNAAFYLQRLDEAEAWLLLSQAWQAHTAKEWPSLKQCLLELRAKYAHTQVWAMNKEKKP